jgi:hypothetical protein
MRLDVSPNPYDLSACTVCADPAERRELTATIDRGNLCRHCLDHIECARCSEVNLATDSTRVPGVGWVCHSCIRAEVDRRARSRAA